MLTLQFLPHSAIAALSSEQRIGRILEFVKENKIVLLEGRLRDQEETELIKKTMESISEDFSGIELGVIHPTGKNTGFYKRIKAAMVKLLLGHQNGFTIIGPANIIKEIKKDPDKIQLYTKQLKTEKKSKKSDTDNKSEVKKK